MGYHGWTMKTPILLAAIAAATGLSFLPSAAPVRAAESAAPAAGATADLPASLRGARDATRKYEQALDAAMADGVTGVASAANATYAPRGKGVWLFQPGQPVPGQDTLTLTISAKGGGARLRVDFMEDASLPNQGPGLAGNGNFCLSGLGVEVDGKPVAISAVGASHEWEVHKAANLIKPASDPSSHWWNAAAHLGGMRTLEITLATPVHAGATLAVKLEARTGWGQHVPGAVRAALVGPELGAVTAAVRADLDAWCDRVDGRARALLDQGPAAVNANAASQAAIARAELVRACGRDKLWQVAAGRGGDAFLRAFLGDPAWVESFLIGSQEGTGRSDLAQALENLRLLHSQNPASTWDDPTSKRLATAMALQGGAGNRYRFVESFTRTEKARADGKLHAGFDQLDVRAMRHAIVAGGTAFEFNGWLDETQFTPGGYVGACWAVPYTDPSVYGYSIQGWGFHDPLRHAYPFARLARSIGGVCGTLSGFGAQSALAHGVPAFTVGQPAHCAYVVRIGDHWATGNDVSGPHTNSWSAYEGLGFISTNALLEKTQNAAAYPAAQRLLWGARAALAAGRPPHIWQAAFEAAVRAQPTNYAVWLEYIKALEGADKANPDQSKPAAWVGMAKITATTFREHQEAGWSLATRCLQNGKAQLATPAARSAKLQELNAILSQKAVPTMYGYDLNRFLNWQADFIGDDAKAVEFFGKLLVLHRSDKPELNWVFGAVLGWGGNYFGARPATSAAYAKAVGDFFAQQGDKADKGQAGAMISQGIRKASEGADLPAYRTWQELAAKLLPPPAPGDLYLNPQQAAACPKIVPFTGSVLSATGMLQTSSQIGYDRPLSYARILDGSAPGFFDTNPEAKPWAQVVLAGEGELSGIVLVNRYEFEAEKIWDVPLKVLTSTDGKTWNQVARFEQPQEVYRVDLQGKGIRAKFVRIEREQRSDNGRLHMRNFVVYGRKLY